MSTRLARACFGVWMVALTGAYYAVPAYEGAVWAALGFSASIAGPAPRDGALPAVRRAGDVHARRCDLQPARRRCPVPVRGGRVLPAVLSAAGRRTADLHPVPVRAADRAALLDALVPTAAIALLVWVFWIGRSSGTRT